MLYSGCAVFESEFIRAKNNHYGHYFRKYSILFYSIT